MKLLLGNKCMQQLKSHIVFFLNAFLEFLPLLCHWVFVLHLPGLGVQLRVIKETLREALLGITTAATWYSMIRGSGSRSSSIVHGTA